MPILRSVLSERPAVEYCDGRRYPKMSPKFNHGRLQFAFSRMLWQRGGDRGAVASEWRCNLSERDSYVPDVSYVSYDRLRPLTDEQRETPTFPPDVAVEIRSPGDDLAYLARKIAGYLAHGTTGACDVDPGERTLTAHFADGRVVALASGDRFADDVVPWLAFDLAELFSDLDIPPPA